MDNESFEDFRQGAARFAEPPCSQALPSLCSGNKMPQRQNPYARRGGYSRAYDPREHRETEYVARVLKRVASMRVPIHQIKLMLTDQTVL